MICGGRGLPCPGGSGALPSFADFGIYEAQGARREMEDATMAVSRLRARRRSQIGGETPSSPRTDPDLVLGAFGVFDGHGGTYFSQYLKTAMPLHLAAASWEDPTAALKQTFAALDEEMMAAVREMPEGAAKEKTQRSGSTANVAVVICDNTGCAPKRRFGTRSRSRGRSDKESDRSNGSNTSSRGSRWSAARRLVVANIGDTRCVVCQDGRAVDLSVDHKADAADEEARIFRAGGIVAERRVMGVLAVARSFGDMHFKRPLAGITWAEDLSCPVLEEDLVTSEPDVTVRELEPDDEFAIIACDGVWDVMSSQDAVDVVREAVDDGLPYRAAARLVVERALERHTMDNVSVLVFGLQPVVGVRGQGRCSVS